MKLKLYIAAIMLFLFAGLIPISAMAEEKKDAASVAAAIATPAAAPAAAAPADPAAAAPATPELPDVKPVLNTGDTAWMLVSSALVLLMIPGLAFFYGAWSVRRTYFPP